MDTQVFTDNADQNHKLATDLTQGFIKDPGLLKTSVCDSSITWLDGSKGELRYRGYAIDELARKFNFQEIGYLLINGELPSSDQTAKFNQNILSSYSLPKNTLKILQLLPESSHPMSSLMNLISILSCDKPAKELNAKNSEQRLKLALHILSTIPTLISAVNAKLKGKTFTDSCIATDTHKITETLLQTELTNDHVFVEALDKILILHADHELNASTFTMRVTGSTKSNIYACLSSAVAALWGSAHGGANEACLKMLENIGSLANIPKYIEKAKDKNDPFKLMGFGHRVYKNFDPRANIMKKICHDVLKVTNQSNQLFEVAMELENIALNDPYFIERKLYPNVDFYSGLTLSAMGLPTSMFTAIFALARTTGWVSHWLEMQNESFKIFRPRQFYQGIKERSVPELAKQ